MSDEVLCEYCGEAVLEGEASKLIPCVFSCGALEMHRYHHECFMRLIVGSVGHQRKECSCFGGSKDDPEGMTAREAARAAARLAIAAGMN